MSNAPGPIASNASLLKVLRDDESARARLLDLLGPDSALADLIGQDAVPARLRVAEAARMAGVPLDRFTAVLSGAAAEPPKPAPPPKPTPCGAGPNDWFTQAEESGAIHLDVRPLLASGRDPFADIMARVPEVPPNGFLLIDAPFDPAPLRRVLAGKGFTSVGRPVGPGHWRICFRRTEGGAVLPSPPPKPGAVWREGNVVHIDVRGMMPPGPLNAVLRLIESSGVESGGAPAIMAHFDRDPVPLYAELEQRGWDCVAKQNHGDEFRLILRPRAN